MNASLRTRLAHDLRKRLNVWRIWLLLSCQHELGYVSRHNKITVRVSFRTKRLVPSLNKNWLAWTPENSYNYWTNMNKSTISCWIGVWQDMSRDDEKIWEHLFGHSNIPKKSSQSHRFYKAEHESFQGIARTKSNGKALKSVTEHTIRIEEYP